VVEGILADVGSHAIRGLRDDLAIIATRRLDS
jgi:hypothetical protein